MFVLQQKLFRSINLCEQKLTCEYLDCIFSAGALQLDDSPTRHSANYSSCSLTDHVYSSFRCGKLNFNVLNYGISIICLLFVKLNVKSLKMSVVI